MLKPFKFVIRNLVAPASLPALAFRGTAIPGSALGFSFFCSGRFPKRAPFACGTVTPSCALGFPGNADLLIGSYSIFVGAQHPPQAGEVRNLSSLVLSSRPKQRRLLPLRSGGIMAWPNDSPSPVIPNKPSQKTIVIPSDPRNLLFLLSSRVAHMPSRSPLLWN